MYRQHASRKLGSFRSGSSKTGRRSRDTRASPWCRRLPSASASPWHGWRPGPNLAPGRERTVVHYACPQGRPARRRGFDPCRAYRAHMALSLRSHASHATFARGAWTARHTDTTRVRPPAPRHGARWRTVRFWLPRGAFLPDGRHRPPSILRLAITSSVHFRPSFGLPLRS